MERLLFEYENNILAGVITHESNDTFARAFVDKIISMSNDIRDNCYCEALRDLLIFECKQWEQSKSIYPQFAIHAIVTILQRKGVILSPQLFETINVQFKSEQSRCVIDLVHETFKEEWEKANFAHNTPHITEALERYMKKENARLFIEDVKKIKALNDKREKAKIYDSFCSYNPDMKPNEQTSIANMLRECTLTNFTKGDINQYNKSRKK